MKRTRVIRCDKGHVFRAPLAGFVGWCHVMGCGSDRITWIRRSRLHTLTPWQRAVLNTNV